jgi:rhodanese-related sulfurtransferase
MRSTLIIVIAVIAIMMSACTPSELQPTKTPSITVEPAQATLSDSVDAKDKVDDSEMTNEEEVQKSIMIDDTPEEFESNMQGDYLLLDVRTQGEFDEGHITDSTLIPVSELERRLDEINEYKNLPVLVYCRSGNRSVTASNILLENGFTNVHNLLGGINAWNNYKSK